MNYTAFIAYLNGSRKLVEGKKANLIAAIKNRESKVKDPDNDVRLAGMRDRLGTMPDDAVKPRLVVDKDTDTPIKRLMRANRPKAAESDKAFQARQAANTKKLPPKEEKANRSEREQEADKNAKRRATLTAAEREAEDDADAAERSKEQDEDQRNRDQTQKDDDERDEIRRREDLSPEDREAEDQNRAATKKYNQERKNRYEKLTPKQKAAFKERGGFKDDSWALGDDSVSDENKDSLDETTMNYKNFRETLQDIIMESATITEASKYDSALTKIIFMEAEIRKIWKVEGKACEQAFKLAVKAAADMKKKLDSIAIKDDESFGFAMNNLNRSAYARYDDQPYDNIDDIEEQTQKAIDYFKPLKPK